MQHLFLIAVIAGTDVAIRSDCIESVVTVGDVVDVPKSDPLVAGLIALRSRVLTLVDCQYAITGSCNASARGNLAVIASVGGHPYGLLVEAVKDVVAVDPDAIHPAAKLDQRWNRIVDEIVEIDGRIVMLLSPAMLLSLDHSLAA